MPSTGYPPLGGCCCSPGGVVVGAVVPFPGRCNDSRDACAAKSKLFKAAISAVLSPVPFTTLSVVAGPILVELESRPPDASGSVLKRASVPSAPACASATCIWRIAVGQPSAVCCVLQSLWKHFVQPLQISTSAGSIGHPHF